jgi:hypothetical protein
MGVVGAGEGELTSPQPVDSAPRPLQAAELLAPLPRAVAETFESDDVALGAAVDPVRRGAST